jgi:glycerol kinase
MDLILAIDQGTTGTTALLMDAQLNRVAEASIDFEQHFPKPGWVEHDLEEIWTSVLQTIREVTRDIDGKRIAAIGITNQRETLCFWERKSSKPLARALVWQDRRTADQCKTLRDAGLEPKFQEATGLLLDPYFSGTKAAWALKNQPEVSKAAREGRLCAGTIDSYLLARLTGGAVHATEPSNASRTLCFNLNTLKFDAELCELLGVPREIWPEVRPSAGVFGLTRDVPGLPNGIPISGILGDQQAALMGQACSREGMAKCTYGTGAFILMNTGRKIARSKHRLLTTIAWSLREGDITYALEGSAFIAGAAVQWARDGLKLIRSAAEIEALAASVPDSDGVTFVPALTGLGAPWWNPQATGMFTGLTRGTNQAHMARAILEGIAFQNADILTAMQKDLGRPIESLNVDGGAAANNLLMQFQSDILGVKLRRPKYLETTSLGAVFAAGLGAGIWTNVAEIERTWKEDRTFTPAWGADKRDTELSRWGKAVARVNWSGA